MVEVEAMLRNRITKRPHRLGDIPVKALSQVAFLLIERSTQFIKRCLMKVSFRLCSNRHKIRTSLEGPVARFEWFCDYLHVDGYIRSPWKAGASSPGWEPHKTEDRIWLTVQLLDDPFTRDMSSESHKNVEDWHGQGERGSPAAACIYNGLLIASTITVYWNNILTLVQNRRSHQYRMLILRAEHSKPVLVLTVKTSSSKIRCYRDQSWIRCCFHRTPTIFAGSHIKDFKLGVSWTTRLFLLTGSADRKWLLGSMLV